LELTEARQELVRTLLGDSLLPGAYGLFGHVGRVLDIHPNDHVLLISPDPAPGALSLAREYGCTITALAAEAEAIERGERRIGDSAERARISLRHGAIERIEAGERLFDVIITEGAFAASRDKTSAAASLFAALRPGGRIALTEPTLYPDLVPEDLRQLFRWLSPLSGARPTPVYRNLLGEQGFTAFVTEERRQDLVRATDAARQKLLLMNLGPGDDDQSGELGNDVEASTRLAQQVLDLIGRGVASYVLISAEKPSR
jgi:hypothetical protein